MRVYQFQFVGCHNFLPDSGFSGNFVYASRDSVFYMCIANIVQV